jgi:3,4-dihydroxy 2-butanone 4-phosphate synthase/GTP cyclohydrolase II
MARHARGLICLSLSPEICDALQLPPMSSRNNSRFGTAFCESIEAAEGVTTGISAADRAHTIRVAIDPASKPAIWFVPAMSFPCGLAKAACWCAPGKPKPRWIWRGWRVCARAA